MFLIMQGLMRREKDENSYRCRMRCHSNFGPPKLPLEAVSKKPKTRKLLTV